MRNPFKRAAPPPAPEPSPELRELVLQLSQRLTKLETDLASIGFQWAEVLDKINAWSARQAARDRRAVKAALGDEPAPVKGEVAPEPEDHAARKLALWRKANQAG